MTKPIAPPALVVGDGPPLVLLHAFPLDGRMWMAQAEALADEYQVIVPDLRGFGGAFAQLDGLAEIPIDLVADDVALLLEERGIEKAAIGGISRGGYIAMSFARRHAEMLSALLLFDTRANPPSEKERQASAEMVERLGREGIASVPDTMKNRLWGKTALAERVDLIERVSDIILSQRPEAVLAGLKGMAARPDARPHLGAIRVKTLAMAGVEDAAFEETKAIAEAIPGARFVAVPDAGHLSVLEQPDLISQEVRRFLAT